MKRRAHRRRCGFTLIELLVVIGVIAVLIAILLPSLAKAKERAREVVCQTRIRGWGQAFIMYISDFDNNLPMDGGDGTTAAPVGRWNDSWLWFNGLTTYMGTGNQTYDQLQLDAKASNTSLPKGGTNSIFVCPSAGDAAAGAGDVMTSPTGSPPYPAGYFLVAGWKTTAPFPFVEQRPMLLCYGMNSQLRQWDFEADNYPGVASATGTQDISKFTMLKPPALVPLLAEKRINPNELTPIRGSQDPNYQKNLAQTKVTANRFAARHNRGGNIVFADGHVEWLNNQTINTGTGSNKNDNYNIPDVVIWSPLGPLGGS